MTSLGSPSQPKVLAIDIGGGATKIALAGPDGGIQHRRSFSTLGPSAAAFLDKVIAAGRQLQAAAELPLAGVSVALAGFVTADGNLEYNANLPWLERAPLASVLRRELALPVQVDADSNAACLAEYLYGAGRGSQRFLCLTGGTGLGVGMVAGGKLLRVAHGCMGDAGHIIVSPQGPLCSCGGRGCAEALLSTAALAQRYAEIASPTQGGFRRLVEDAGQGAPQATQLIREAGRWLGIAAASLASIFLPDRIAIAGGLSHAGDELLTAAQAAFHAHGGRFPVSRATLVRALNGEHATLLGAAAAFFHPELL